MNQLMRFEDLREWLVSKVNDSVEVVGEDELILDFIRKLDAAPSATGAPVAWMYEEDGERMFGHPDGYRPKDAVPLYAAPVDEIAIGNARYEYLRKLNPREFAALYDEALADERFDDLVDRYRMKGGQDAK
jgi:hypothetical protein